MKKLLLTGLLALGMARGQSTTNGQPVRVVDDNGSTQAQQFDNTHANLTGTVVNVNTTGTVLKGLVVYNTTTTACYLQFFNATAANVTLGTTAPTTTLPFAANAASPATGSNSVILPASGELFKFATALSVAATTTQTGSTGCAMSVTIFYSAAPTLQ